MGSASTKYFLLIFGYVLSFFRAEKGARGLLRILYIADGAKTAKARRKNPSASVGAERRCGETGKMKEDDAGGTPFDKGASPGPHACGERRGTFLKKGPAPPKTFELYYISESCSIVL